MAVRAPGRPLGTIELAEMRVRMTVDAAFAESCPDQRIGPVRPGSSVALSAAWFHVSRFQSEARLIMVESDTNPALHRVTLLAAATLHETVQLAAVRIIVAIYAQD